MKEKETAIIFFRSEHSDCKICYSLEKMFCSNIQQDFTLMYTV